MANGGGKAGIIETNFREVRDPDGNKVCVFNMS